MREPYGAVGGGWDNALMLLAEVVTTSTTVAATRSRRDKVAAIADLLRRTGAEEVELVTTYLAGRVRQRRTGLGWRSLSSPPQPSPVASLTVPGLDQRLEDISVLTGSGSGAARASAVAELLGLCTADEQAWLRGVLTGAVRQGALDAVVQDGVAAAAGLPADAVRRAAMFAGSTPPVALVALLEGAEGLAGFTLEVGRPVLPMLASSAPDVGAAMAKAAGGDDLVAIDQKLDGVRIQVHKDGHAVHVASRSLDDLTPRMPEVVEVVRGLPAERLVLDGEVISLDESGVPRAFQDTASRAASGSTGLSAYFFDLLLHDDTDLVDAPTRERLSRLAEVVPAHLLVPRLVTEDLATAQAFLADTVSSGHEGVVVKSLSAPYAAGRRGSAWVKVKPVHTLDLVVLAVEHGSGRRRGWLSNIHLGARDPESGGWVMLGKTFKGMTDETLRWQTERFRELAVEDDGWVVRVRPEQVVEVAFDGVQRSTTYPGGVALRFARVVRYRDDKPPEDADTIETVRAHLPG
jgi:DNA ligase-1